MPLTEKERRTIRDMEARLMASSPDLARTLSTPLRPARVGLGPLGTGRPGAGPSASRWVVAAILVSLVVSLVLATVADATGAGMAWAGALVAVEAGLMFMAAHFTGYRWTRRKRSR